MKVYPKKVLDLKTETNQPVFYNPEKLKYACEETEAFLDGINFINSIDFTKSVLFPYEVKFNNAVEGYNDDLSHIMDVINFPNDEGLKNREDYYRQRNLIIGYEYILKKKEINKETLRKLYSILSNNLLEQQDIIPKNDYYRRGPVFIHHSSRIDLPEEKIVDKCMAPELVEGFIQNLLDYINDATTIDNPMEAYIKSQIIHYYFVYVHPYYDINGRTSRTLSLWYLINNEAFPFTIFNRSIPHTKSKYYQAIKEAKIGNNVTFFLIYMLNNIKKEIEKEYIINSIDSNVNGNLSVLEKQTLQYILENKVPTVLDFCSLYNRFNHLKKAREIYETMITPLADKNIIFIGRSTNKNMFNDVPNKLYELNTSLIDDNNGKIKIFDYEKR